MNSKENNFNDDHEIDLIEVFKTIWVNKFKILLACFITVVFTVIVSINSTKLYESYTTFHINEENNASSLSSYAGMLGMNTNSNLNNIVNSLLKSTSIKKEIAKEYQNTFEKELQKAISKQKLINSPEHIINYTINLLELESNITIIKSKEGLMKLSYLSKSAEQSQQILKSYLKLLEKFNSKLEISAEKKFLTIIDPPNLPLNHSKPNLKLNIVLGFIVSSTLSSLFFLIRKSLNQT